MTLTLNETTKPHLKRWTKQEFNDAVERGFIEGKRIILFRGELIEMPAMGALHAFGVANITDWLSDTFRPQYRIRIQLPFQIPGDTVPQPDGAVVTHEQMSRRPHPDQALL